MKLVLQNVLFLLGFVAYNYICLAKDNINIGAFLYEYETTQPINWSVVRDNIPATVNFTEPTVTIVPEYDAFKTSKIFCKAAAQNTGFLAVFGPKSRLDSSVIEHACSYFKIPYFLAHWTPTSSSLNLYPESKLFTQALVTVIQSLDWKRFIIIYEDDERLIHLQDVLKFQQYREGYEKNDVSIKPLGPGSDYRPLLKEIFKSGILKIILNCRIEKILEILKQSLDVKLLPDISTSFFLVSLDAHTLDFSTLIATSNMTTMRLFNPYDEAFRETVRYYYPNIPPEKITVQTALRHDAMLLLAEGIKSILDDNPSVDISSFPRSCNGTKQYKDRLKLIEKLKQVEEINGLTGQISLQRGQREKFTLEVIQADKPNAPIAVWNSEKPESIHLTRDATEREAEFKKRIMNYNFIISSRIGKPYLMETHEPGATGNRRYKGYSMDLISEIADILNVTFQFVIAKKHNDIVDDLVNRRADLGICDFTITHQRRELIDFSMPFMSLGISIIHKEPEVKGRNNMYAFMDPFSWKVWIYIATLYLILSLIILVIARFDPEDWENPHPCNQHPEELENIWNIKNCFWLTLGSVMTQGSDILPKGVSSRIATAMWWFFSLIMTSSYTANMAAFLTMQKGGDTINSVEELAKQNKVKYGIMKGGSTQEFFKYSNNSLYQKMWSVIKNENPSVFEDSNDKGVERVASTKHALYAFFMESTQIEYELERRCELRKVGSWLDSKSYGIGMPFGAVYRHLINSAVLTLQENGKLIKLKEKWWKEDLEGEPCSNRNDEFVNKDELTLAHVGGVFIVLGAGLMLAFTFALVEFLWNVHTLALEEQMTYLEALKCELKFACNIWVTRKKVKLLKSENSSSQCDKKSPTRTIFAGAGSVLNINASVLNRMANVGK